MKIVIISPDAVRLSLIPSAPEIKIENGKEFNLREKCVRATALGQRSEIFARYLSNFHDVTLLIPDLNFPGNEYINYKMHPYKIDTYNWNASCWKKNDDLNNKLKDYDYVILQSTTGSGFENVSELSNNIKVIVDGWVPFPVEFACAIMESNESEKIWNTGIKSYEKLVDRADCILYANDSQYSFYVGMLTRTNKFNNCSYVDVPLLKVPYGFQNKIRIPNLSLSQKLRLVWYGPIYPWYDPEPVFEVAEKLQDILTVDFIGAEHPRFKQMFNNKYKDLLNKNSNIIRWDRNYSEEPQTISDRYDAGIILGKPWIENKFSNRCRIIDMISYGMPVITNTENPLLQEYPLNLRIHGVNSSTIVDDLKSLCKSSKLFSTTWESDNELLYSAYNTEKCFEQLIDYLVK